MGLYLHAFTHDISKFMPSEFFPYAIYFYGQFKTEDERNQAKEVFDRAWLRHQNRNGHHWDHWVDAQGVVTIKATGRQKAANYLMNVLDSVDGMTENLRVLPVREDAAQSGHQRAGKRERRTKKVPQGVSL